MFDNQSILITGATGSFGRACCCYILNHFKPRRLIVFSRDELKQHSMQCEEEFKHPAMRFFLGDVRDKDRLVRAMSGVDIVIHAAALKQVPAAEYNPHEFIKTNIHGAMNVVDASLEAGVQRVIALSTDKAANPINLYGATKLCSDKIFIAGNSYSGSHPTRFAVVRYGNVIGSRGSVIPLFVQQRAGGAVTVTDPKMTRFLLTLDQGVKFVIDGLYTMTGGELFVPKIPSCTIGDLASAIAPRCRQKVIGLRPGEKMHEALIPQDEAHLVLEFPRYFIVKPTLPFWGNLAADLNGRPVPADFSYSSDNNADQLSIEQLQELCAPYVEAALQEAQLCAN